MKKKLDRDKPRYNCECIPLNDYNGYRLSWNKNCTVHVPKCKFCENLSYVKMVRTHEYLCKECLIKN